MDIVRMQCTFQNAVTIKGMLLVALFLFVSIRYVDTASESSLCFSNKNVDAMLVALLPLHRGHSCDQVNLKPMQQMAAAQHTLSELNNAAGDDDLFIGLQVMDTCSNIKRAVRITFKTLVMSDPSICKKAPIFLGYLGPDNKEVLDEVRKVTSALHVTHVIPYSTLGQEESNTFHVNMINPTDTLKAIQQLLKEIKWSAISLLHSVDQDSSHLASTFMASSRSPCVASLHTLPTTSCLDAPDLLFGIPTVGVVVIGTAESLADLLHCISTSSESHVYMFVVREAGVLPPLSLLSDLPNSVLVMQENNQEFSGLEEQLKQSPLWDEYLYQQECNYSACGNIDADLVEYALIQDPSVTAVAQTIRLYARALRIAHKLKCGGNSGRCPMLNELPPDEWRGILRSASDRSAKFSTEKRSVHMLYYKSAFSLDLKKIGNVTDKGRHVSIDKGFQILSSHLSKCGNVSHFVTTTSPLIPATTATVSSDISRVIPVIHDTKDVVVSTDETRVMFGGPNFNIFDITSYSMEEFSVLMVIFASTVAILFSIIIYFIYSSFRVKTNDERSRDGSSRCSSVRST